MRPRPRPAIRVLLVDNCCTFGDGLEIAIVKTKTLQLIRRANSAAECFETGAEMSADIALVDIDLPDQSGFEVCQRLLNVDPKMKVVLMSFSDWDIYLLAAKTVHSSGLLLRSQPAQTIIAVLENAVDGPVFSGEQNRRIQTWQNTIGFQLKNLKKREWQVLQLVALGQSNKEIAEHLSVTKSTVEKHVSNILEKLELSSRGMMMVFIYTHHLEALSRLPHGDRFLMLLTN